MQILCASLVQAISWSLALSLETIWKVSTALNTSVLLPCPGGVVLDRQDGQMALPLQPSYAVMEHLLTVGWWQNHPPDLARRHFFLIFQAEMIFDPIFDFEATSSPFGIFSACLFFENHQSAS